MVLNKAQAQELAQFFFDLAKGFILGGVGFTAITPAEIKLAMAIASLILTYFCIRIGLTLLKEDR